jgi:predicted ATPase
MRVESIRLKNFRAFRDVHLRDVPGFCVLIGANGTGKSTLFSVFSFLRDAMVVALETAKDADLRRLLGEMRDLVTACTGARSA